MFNRIEAAKLKQAAKGRWLDIFSSCGLPSELLDGKGHACPKCGGRDRFAAWPDVADRGAVHCRRCFTAGSVPGPSDGLATLQWLLDSSFTDACQWLAEWLGIEPTQTKQAVPIVRTITIAESAPVPAHIRRIYQQSVNAMKRTWIERLARDLRLPAEAVARLKPGWCSSHKAWTFPMVDEFGQLVGVRLRKPTGEKRSIWGSRAGIFVPEGNGGERLFVTEGPTDTAALVALGLSAIGRPSCNGAKRLTIAYIRQVMPAEVIVVADDDEAGVKGAESLASDLMRIAPVRLMVPPVKDCRQWFINGCTADEIMAAATALEIRTPSVRCEVRI